MLVTIYTDGGISEGKHVWAFRARSHKGWLSATGLMAATDHIERVEFEAVRQASFLVLKKWPGTTVLFFNVDNMSVCVSLWTQGGYKKGKVCKSLLKVLPAWYQDMTVLDVTVRIKHVKGHKGSGNIRHYMNNSVDKMVRKTYKQ